MQAGHPAIDINSPKETRNKVAAKPTAALTRLHPGQHLVHRALPKHPQNRRCCPHR